MHLFVIQVYMFTYRQGNVCHILCTCSSLSEQGREWEREGVNYGWEGGRGGGAQMGGKEIGKERVKKGVILYEHTLTTKEEIESGSSRAVEERTSSSRKQKRVILGKLLCKERETHTHYIRLDFHFIS